MVSTMGIEIHLMDSTMGNIIQNTPRPTVETVGNVFRRIHNFTKQKQLGYTTFFHN
jgi:hypothetical protein